MVLTLVGIWWYLSWPVLVDITDENFLELQKCPACYGDHLCSDVFHRRFDLTNFTRFNIIRKLFNAKNVYYGIFYQDDQEEEVVIKKLGHDRELAKMDQLMCDMAQRDTNCVSSLASKWSNGRTLEFHLFKTGLDIEALKCVQNQDMIDFLASKAHVSNENFLTLAMINPEPLIASAFPYAAGWPFPKYYGACGRLAVFERVKSPLENYLSSPWATKARLALQVLQMAKKMSDNEPLGLYLTDWSLDNFAVTAKLEVKLIDLENIVLVNKTVIKTTKAPGWNIDHHSVAFGCEEDQEDCFSYSVEDLCSHVVSDHNYYGACQGIFNDLKVTEAMPKDARQKFPMLERLLKECSWPSHPGGRIEAARELIEILKQI